MTKDDILKALESVIDPELRRNIVELDMVRSIDIRDGGVVDVMVSLTTPGCPIRNHFQTGVANAVKALDGVTHVNVSFDVLTDQQKATLQQKLGRGGGLPSGALARVANVLCVGSGKGGVGNDRPLVSAQRKIIPLEAHGLKVMSIGFFMGSEDAAVVWRGPMLHKALTQFLEDVDWGELDYLLIDLPPGTGDVSMTLSQLLPQALFLLVTTPQPAAQKVAKRAAESAARFELEIAGVIENMSGFTTPSGERFTIFGEGGGQLLADELDVPLLGKVPLQEELRTGADEGRPLVLSDPDAPASQAIYHAARGLIAAAPPAPLMQQPVNGHLEPPPAPVTGTPLPMAP